MQKPIILVLIGISIILGIAVFSSSSSEEPEIINNKIIEYEDTFTIGTIHRDSAKMTKRYLPLAEYIAAELSDENKVFKGKVQIIPSQEEMINSIKNQEMDLYFDSPLIGLKIADKSEISPFLMSWKEGHRNYHTVFMTLIDSDVTFDNLYDKTIIFEDTESTSGFLLPVFHLEKAGYVIDENSSDSLSFDFSLDDENTPVWLVEGRGDVGATSNLDFNDIPKNIIEKLKVIESTESIPRQIVFIGNHVESQDKLKNILLEMNHDEETLKILEKISRTSKFTEIDFENDLKHVMEILEQVK